MSVKNAWHRLGNRPYRLYSKSEGFGPPIVFLHGIGSSSSNWATLTPLLKDNFTCVTIDLLGFGNSPKPNWSKYRIEDHLKSIEFTIKKLGLKEDFILVGHSLGSLLACRYAAVKNSDNIKRLIMISPPVYLHPSHHGSALVKNTTGAYLKLYKFMRAHKKFTMRNIALIAKLLPSPGILNIDESTWHAFRCTLENCIENQTVITDIVRVNVPIDILYGSLDQFVIPYNISILGKMNGVSVSIVKGASHIIKPTLATAVANKIKDL